MAIAGYHYWRQHDRPAHQHNRQADLLSFGRPMKMAFDEQPRCLDSPSVSGRMQFPKSSQFLRSGCLVCQLAFNRMYPIVGTCELPLFHGQE